MARSLLYLLRKMITLSELRTFGQEMLRSAERVSNKTDGKLELRGAVDHYDELRAFRDRYESDHQGCTLTFEELQKYVGSLLDLATAADASGPSVGGALRLARTLKNRGGRNDQALDEHELRHVRLQPGGNLIDTLIRGIDRQREEMRMIHELQKEAAQDPVAYAGTRTAHLERMDALLNIVGDGGGKLHQRLAFMESFCAVGAGDHLSFARHAAMFAELLRDVRDRQHELPAAVVNHVCELISSLALPSLSNDTIADISHYRSELRARGSARLPRLPEVSRHGQFGPWSFGQG